MMASNKKPSKDPDDFDEDAMDKTSIVPSDTFKVRLAQAGQAPPCLVFPVGPANMICRQWPLQDTDLILGRSDTCYVYISDKSISKSHAKLVLSGGEVSIIDLESTNKTVVNGQVVTPLKPLKLKNNDQIKVGNVIFKYLERGNIETVSAAETFGRGLMDPLTEINNKGAFENRANESFRKSELLGIPLSMITFDIDFFKKVNDHYGHSVGDYILKELARVVRDTLIRENDFFARTGGEEFTLLLLGSNLKEAKDVAERVRLKIENHHFETQEKVIPITVSVGVSIKNPKDRDWQEIFDRADKALYRSKSNGRNQITVFNEES